MAVVKSAVEKKRKGGEGFHRYMRYCLVFDRIETSIESGFDIEAIALLESLMCDRLSSRLAFKTKKDFDSKLTLGQASRKLLLLSDEDDEFRARLLPIKEWADHRNKAVHEMAKILRDRSSKTQHFKEILTENHDFAVLGVRLLREYDTLDRKDRRRAKRNPASHPAAFFPERRTRTAKTFMWLEMQGLLPKDTEPREETTNMSD